MFAKEGETSIVERTVYMKEGLSGLAKISKGNYKCLFLNKLIKGLADKYLKIMVSICYI